MNTPNFAGEFAAGKLLPPTEAEVVHFRQVISDATALRSIAKPAEVAVLDRTIASARDALQASVAVLERQKTAMFAAGTAPSDGKASPEELARLIAPIVANLDRATRLRDEAAVRRGETARR